MTLQVKLAITHHTVTAAANDSLMVTSDKPLVFVLDQPKQDDGKRRKSKSKKNKGDKGGLKAQNFGSVVDISKMKDAKRFVVGWRARLLNNMCILYICSFAPNGSHP